MARIREGFGQAVADKLKEKRWSYRQAALVTGIDYNTIYNMKTGITPTRGKVIQWAEGLREPINEWLKLAGYEEVSPSLVEGTVIEWNAREMIDSLHSWDFMNDVVQALIARRITAEQMADRAEIPASIVRAMMQGRIPSFGVIGRFALHIGEDPIEWIRKAHIYAAESLLDRFYDVDGVEKKIRKIIEPHRRELRKRSAKSIIKILQDYPIEWEELLDEPPPRIDPSIDQAPDEYAVVLDRFGGIENLSPSIVAQYHEISLQDPPDGPILRGSLAFLHIGCDRGIHSTVFVYMSDDHTYAMRFLGMIDGELQQMDQRDRVSIDDLRDVFNEVTGLDIPEPVNPGEAKDSA